MEIGKIVNQLVLALAFAETSSEVWRASQVAEREFQLRQQPIQRNELQRETLELSIDRQQLV